MVWRGWNFLLTWLQLPLQRFCWLACAHWKQIRTLLCSLSSPWKGLSAGEQSYSDGAWVWVLSFCCHEASQQGHNTHQCSITLTFVYGQCDRCYLQETEEKHGLTVNDRTIGQNNKSITLRFSWGLIKRAIMFNRQRFLSSFVHICE